MSDQMTTQRGIEGKISLLEKCRGQLQSRAEERARAISDYDKALAVTMLKMSNGQVMELDGNKIENPKTTVIEKLAKGYCWKERLEMEKAESMYKSLITAINCVQAELNGLQSVNRTASQMMN